MRTWRSSCDNWSHAKLLERAGAHDVNWITLVGSWLVTRLKLRPHSIAHAMYAMFAMHGKIAAFTDNVRGHTKLHTLCTLCWRCSYVAVLFDSWLYFETSLRTGMRSRPHAVTCSRQYVICCLLRQFRNTFNWVCVLRILWVMFLEQLIEEVRKYPCLWNKSKEEYRNQNVRDKAWERISGELEKNR